ncbi:hypothetical protein NQF86_00350 [Bombella sp. TMW 2.2543]|uniref:Phage neck terminator protein gp12-like domain-containing protein n=1 Tax=Bombella pluederhausensis TaxID=2967336 RepID=A0ABT3WE29_9PROT|nr:hypothetical protein [Bombella pluederhausensis]MCX5617123.1 hypothetical protein [Bombella pluederhausensis]
MVSPDRHTSDPADSQLSPSESTIMQMVGDWLKATALPSDWALFQGQQNRLPPPRADFMVMQAVSRRPLATNHHEYSPTSVTITQPIELSIQLTAYGAAALTVFGSISTLWRDAGAVSWFQQRRNDMAPLGTGPLSQHGFISAEQRYDDSATLTLTLVVETRLCRPVETATALAMSSITEADLTDHN